MDRICTALVQAGYFVTLVGFEKKNSIETEQKPYAQIRFKLLFTKGKLFYAEYNLRLFWYLLWRRFDIYNGIDLDTLLPVFLAAKIKRRPIVYDAHEYFTELPEVVSRPGIKKMWLALERFLLPRIRYNYTVGEAIAEILSNTYGQPVHVIRNVPYLRDTPRTERKPYIVYQGALNQGRGLEPLFAAMADVDAELWVVGEGDLSAPLRTLAATFPHGDKIKFLGYKRPAVLKEITEQAMLGVNLVEHLGLSYYYSLSNKFFDYIHAGIPQVTMHFPEYTRLNAIYHVAELIPDLKPETISMAINAILKNKQHYTTLAENTEIARRELNWQKEEEKLIAIYRQIG